MRHIIFATCGIAAALGLIGCGAGAGDVGFETESIEWADSLSVDSSKAVCRINAVWPTQGGHDVVDSVRMWIVAQLGRNGYVGYEADAPVYKIDVDNSAEASAIVASIGTGVLSKAKAELESVGYDFPMTYEYSWNVWQDYKTAKIVTFGAETYAFVGGAHGSSTYFGQTFSLADGCRLGWNMFDKDKMAELRDIICQGLMTQYFEVGNREELKDCMLIDPDTLPMPAADPVCGKSGMVFTYQQYEIAPYAAGMPTVAVPYAVITPLLTAKARALMPSEAD